MASSDRRLHPAEHDMRTITIEKVIVLLVMKLATVYGIHPEEAEVIVEPSAKVNIISLGIKFKDMVRESSKARHKHSTSDNSSSNPIALLNRIMNNLKSNGRRNKQQSDMIMKMLAGGNSEP
ncbi:hypothetical protein PIB30_057867 [Stylosanthes scabra]|uniref:Uncharacterized protein n=1 Tax=Stylosanthes scabra TaxID=79078 RepID=A0ABU6QJI0_9FABA|nr:hypothetical protein [Stylosanthes scabra]